MITRRRECQRARRLRGDDLIIQSPLIRCLLAIEHIGRKGMLAKGQRKQTIFAYGKRDDGWLQSLHIDADVGTAGSDLVLDTKGYIERANASGLKGICS